MRKRILPLLLTVMLLLSIAIPAIAAEDTPVPISRADFVMALYLALEEPASDGVNPFSDVADDAEYTNAVIWAAAAGIVNGKGDGTFAPGDALAREEAATLMLNYAKSEGNANSGAMLMVSFLDAEDISSWATVGVMFSTQNELIEAKDTGFGPQGTVTAAEASDWIAALITRELTIPTIPTVVPPVSSAGAHGTIAYRHLQYIEENLPYRFPYTQREKDTADWIVQELLDMGHDPENIAVQEFLMNPENPMLLPFLMALEAGEIPEPFLPIMDAFNVSGFDDIKALEFIGVSQNVILTVPGVSEKTIIVGAHYDGAHNVGISDNASGTVVLLESAERILDLEHYYTITYVFFGAEEVGLDGVLHYVDALTEKEAEDIVLMINVDVIFDGTALTYGVGYHDFAANAEGTNQIARNIMEIADDLNEEFGFELVRQPGGVYVTSDQLAFLFTGQDVLVFYSMDNFEPAAIAAIAAGTVVGIIPELTVTRLELLAAILDGSDEPDIVKAIANDRAVLDFFMQHFVAATPIEVVQEQLVMISAALAEAEVAELREAYDLLTGMLAVLEHPNLTEYLSAQFSGQADTMVGLVLHTENDNLDYITVTWPGLIEKALEAYSAFMEAILILPAGSLG